MTSDDYYAVLGVGPEADAAAIRRAYLSLARTVHPDHAAAPGSAERMALINEAYAVLGHPGRRIAYDRKRKRRPETGRSATDVPPGEPETAYAFSPAAVVERYRGIPEEVNLTPVSVAEFHAAYHGRRRLRHYYLFIDFPTDLRAFSYGSCVGRIRRAMNDLRAANAAGGNPARGLGAGFTGALVSQEIHCILVAGRPAAPREVQAWGRPPDNVRMVLFDYLSGRLTPLESRG
jgi:curved DNA-binding protein CbpA